MGNGRARRPSKNRNTCYTSVVTEGNRFDFIAGTLSLDFLDTLGNRRSEPSERLGSPRDLDEWLAGAGLRTPKQARATARDLQNAWILRNAIHAATSGLASDSRVEGRDVQILNFTAARMPLRPSMTGGKLVWTAPKPVSAAFSIIAADALDLIAGPRHSRIRICPECKMMFLDTSRPGKRRWCSSSSGCGNKAKLRAYRARAARLESV